MTNAGRALRLQARNVAVFALCFGSAMVLPVLLASFGFAIA